MEREREITNTNKHSGNEYDFKHSNSGQETNRPVSPFIYPTAISTQQTKQIYCKSEKKEKAHPSSLNANKVSYHHQYESTESSLLQACLGST